MIVWDDLSIDHISSICGRFVLNKRHMMIWAIKVSCTLSSWEDSTNNGSKRWTVVECFNHSVQGEISQNRCVIYIGRQDMI